MRYGTAFNNWNNVPELYYNRENQMLNVVKEAFKDQMVDIEKLVFKDEDKVMNKASKLITVEKVIFNDPATIVFWSDGTKTIVKVKDGETFDKWTGFAMAHMKKIYGEDFHKTFRTYCEE